MKKEDVKSFIKDTYWLILTGIDATLKFKSVVLLELSKKIDEKLREL